MGELAVKKEEVIFGKVVMLATGSPGHATVCHNLGSLFHAYLKGRHCKSFGGEVTYQLAEDIRVIPDLSVICSLHKLEGTIICGAPALVVEVLSPGTAQYDRGDKMLAYYKYGVKEYWIADPKRKSIEVYTRSDAYFRCDQLAMLDDPLERESGQAPLPTAVSSLVIEGFVADLYEVFDGLDTDLLKTVD